MLDRKKKGLSGPFVLTLLLAFFLSLPASGYDGVFPDALSYGTGIKAGPLKMHAGLKVRGTYDDNIYNRPTEEKEDFIVSASPGVLLNIGDRYRLDIGYSAEINRYIDFTEENFVAHRGKGGVSLNLPSGVSIQVQDVFTKTEDPRPEELQLRASHIFNNAFSSIGYEFPAKRLSIEVSYSMGYLKYDQDDNSPLNRRDDTLTGSVYYRFLPKSSALVEYSLGMIDYFDIDGSKSPNSSSHAVNAGLKWDPTAKLSGTVKGGLKWRYYENNIDPLLGIEYEDARLISTAADLNFRATGSSLINLSAVRAIEETSYRGNPLAGYSAGNHYLRTGGGVGLRQGIGRALSFDIKTDYKKDDYDNIEASKTGRVDDIIGGEAGIDLNFKKWFTVRLNYYRSNTDSNDDARDELHNKVHLTISAAI